MHEVNKFSAIRIHLASPDQIRSWSYGEVVKPETINYRTLKPERDGLFCERIFGPTKDWECACGKYKRIRYRGIICDKCGVEVTRSRIRRERMGHIELAAPVTHIWFLKGTPSRIGQILDVTPRDLEKIVYFASFIVTDLDEEERDDALGRIQHDLEARIQEITDDTNAHVDAAAERLDDQTRQFDEQLAAELARLDDEAEANRVAARDAAAGPRKLLAAVGRRPLEDDVALDWLDKPLFSAGAAPPKDALDQLDAAVAAEIEAVNGRAEAEKQTAHDRFDHAKAAERRDTDQETARLEQEAVQLTADARDFFEQRRADLESLELHKLLTEPQYQQFQHTCGDVFEAGIGAEAVLDLIQRIDLDQLAEELRVELNAAANSKQKRSKAVKRLKVVESFRRSDQGPEWLKLRAMILTVLPVLPPELRPMVQLDGGRFATSDLNDLYRRVINRNNRLKRLQDLGAPEIIVRNEKRMLQEAVDALIDNGRRGRAVTGSSNHPYKSLSDLLRGKQGRFRQNLLGKRVDYSGRSVIVVGPHLKLNQCGLPTKMALELFKPFVMRKLVDYGYASNIKSAKRMVEHPEPVVWDALEEVTRNHPVLLNRAPTLHRLGIQAFDIVLVRGSAIQIHPLVCTAFNADFDGDQMAVHVPLSRAAQDEAREIMKSTRNILSPADGTPIITPTKDMVLGCYYLTEMADGRKGEGKKFATFADAVLAYEHGAVDLHAKIQVRVTPEDFPVDEPGRGDQAFLETTAGRVMLNQALPRRLRPVNERLEKNGLRRVIEAVFYSEGLDATGDVTDRIQTLGMEWATRSGVTMGTWDLEIPSDKPKILADTHASVDKIEDYFAQGLLTDTERYAETVKTWLDATAKVSSEVEKTFDELSPVYMLGNSGAAKGDFDQIRQITGMRGLMSDPTGKIIETPVRANFREGMSVLEYFISTHGGRKGLTDTALRTAESGYLTRRLVDVAQDVIITGDDCGTEAGIPVEAGSADEVLGTVGERCFGRYPAEPIVDPATGEILAPLGTLIDHDLSQAIDRANVEYAEMRSPMTCANPRGLCRTCYGMDLARHELVVEGAAVGVIAAQSMGEPATQLTMRTRHLGGVVAGVDIVDTEQGLPRVQELFEVRRPKGVAVISDIEGTVEIVEEDEQRRVRVTSAHVHDYTYPLDVRLTPIVGDGAEVEQGAQLALPDHLAADPPALETAAAGSYPLAKAAGMVEVRDDRIVVRAEAAEGAEETAVSEHLLDVRLTPIVDEGAEVERGTPLALPPELAEDLLARKARSKTKTISKRALTKVAGAGVTAEAAGVVSLRDGHIVLRAEEREQNEFPISPATNLLVRNGEHVEAGQQLTEGALNPHDILELRGPEALQQYIVKEVQRVYRMVGVAVHDKHIEVIIRQMLRRDMVDHPGDTGFLPGELVDRAVLAERNREAAEDGKQQAASHPVLLGVTKASLSNESFLAAASFQDTTRVLTEAVVEGKTDSLHGLKENVIIGKLIPAGTGWARYHGPVLEDSEQPESLVDTEAMPMADGLPMDELLAPTNGADAAVDAADPAPLMDAAVDDELLAGVEAPAETPDARTDFLKVSDDPGVEESSVFTAGADRESDR